MAAIQIYEIVTAAESFFEVLKLCVMLDYAFISALLILNVH
jgi:hypothetical protein